MYSYVWYVCLSAYMYVSILYTYIYIYIIIVEQNSHPRKAVACWPRSVKAWAAEAKSSSDIWEGFLIEQQPAATNPPTIMAPTGDHHSQYHLYQWMRKNINMLYMLSSMFLQKILVIQSYRLIV